MISDRKPAYAKPKKVKKMISDRKPAYAFLYTGGAKAGRTQIAGEVYNIIKISNEESYVWPSGTTDTEICADEDRLIEAGLTPVLITDIGVPQSELEARFDALTKLGISKEMFPAIERLPAEARRQITDNIEEIIRANSTVNTTADTKVGVLPPVTELKKDEIIKILSDADIEFDPNAKKEELYDLAKVL